MLYKYALFDILMRGTDFSLTMSEEALMRDAFHADAIPK